MIEHYLSVVGVLLPSFAMLRSGSGRFANTSNIRYGNGCFFCDDAALQTICVDDDSIDDTTSPCDDDTDDVVATASGDVA